MASRLPLSAGNVIRSMTLDLHKLWARFIGGLMDTGPTGNMPMQRTLLAVKRSDTTQADVRVTERASGYVVCVGNKDHLGPLDRATLVLLRDCLISVTGYLDAKEPAIQTTSDTLGILMEAVDPWYSIMSEHRIPRNPSK